MVSKKKKTHSCASLPITLSLCISVTFNLKNYNETPLFQGINTSCFNWSAFVSTFPLANSIM